MLVIFLVVTEGEPDKHIYFEMDAEVTRWKAPNSKLELAITAPRLLSLRDCILVVPGKLIKT